MSITTKCFAERRRERRKKEMYSYSKLRGKITEKFGTQAALAEALGVSLVSVSKKLNGVTGFSQEDIEKWSNLLDISKAEYPDYFFA